MRNVPNWPALPSSAYIAGGSPLRGVDPARLSTPRGSSALNPRLVSLQSLRIPADRAWVSRDAATVSATCCARWSQWRLTLFSSNSAKRTENPHGF